MHDSEGNTAGTYLARFELGANWRGVVESLAAAVDVGRIATIGTARTGSR